MAGPESTAYTGEWEATSRPVAPWRPIGPVSFWSAGCQCVLGHREEVGVFERFDASAYGDKDDEANYVVALGDVGGRLYVRRSGTVHDGPPPSTFMIITRPHFLFCSSPMSRSLLFPLVSTLM